MSRCQIKMHDRTRSNRTLTTDRILRRVEYKKKNHREKGPALLGIVVKKREDIDRLIGKMKEKKIVYQYLNDQSDLFQYIV